MSETVREWLDGFQERWCKESFGTAPTPMDDATVKATLRTIYMGLDEAGVLGAPIVRCGGKDVVLAVDREELAEALFDDDVKDAGAEDTWAGLTEAQRDLWRDGIDAILSKLELRKVECVGQLDYDCDGSVSVDGREYGSPTPVGDTDTVAILKPAASKEDE